PCRSARRTQHPIFLRAPALRDPPTPCPASGLRPPSSSPLSAPSPPEASTLSLHDALPIFRSCLAERLRPARFIKSMFDLRTGILDRKSTRLNSSHVSISYAVFCLKTKKKRRRTGARAHQERALRVAAPHAQPRCQRRPPLP